MVLIVGQGRLCDGLPLPRLHLSTGLHSSNCWHAVRAPPLPASQRACRQKHPAQRTTCRSQAARSTGEIQIAIPPEHTHPPARLQPQRSGSSSWVFLLAAAAAAGYVWFARTRPKEVPSVPLPDPEVNQLDVSETKEYQKALARTRQAVSVHKALGYMDAGTPARAMVELKRALAENALVREPVLTDRYEKKHLQELYRLHVANSEMPPQFSTLLQLRELLAISDKEAERLEAEVMESGAQFSI